MRYHHIAKNEATFHLYFPIEEIEFFEEIYFLDTRIDSNYRGPTFDVEDFTLFLQSLPQLDFFVILLTKKRKTQESAWKSNLHLSSINAID